MAVPPDAVPVAAAGVVAPASRPAPGLVEEDEPAQRVAADSESIADAHDLEQRRQEVARERAPSGAVGGDAIPRIEPVAGVGEDLQDVVGPAAVRTAQPPDHLADRDEV